MNILTCETCRSRLRAVALASNDEGPQEVEYSCHDHGPQWRWEYREWKKVQPVADNTSA